MSRMKLRLRCCRCGRVQKATVASAQAFSQAELLIRRACPGPRCRSRDLRLDVRAVAR
jgi:hypothetical protein